MQSTQPNQPSHLLIISHDKEDFTLLGDILQHYFPIQQQQHSELFKNDNDDVRLMIKNKYYKAEVKMSNLLWRETQLFRYSQIVQQEKIKQQKQQQAQQQVQTTTQSQQQTQTQIPNTNQSTTTITNIQQPKKYDLMIMLINQPQQQTIDLSSLDILIQTVNPQQFVLLINTQHSHQQWKYQEVILEKCNNFIQIVKEDLGKVKENKPIWSRGALLNDDEENLETGVFSVLDRMETTRWSTMVNIKQDKHYHHINVTKKEQQSKEENKQKVDENNKKQQKSDLSVNKQDEKLQTQTQQQHITKTQHQNITKKQANSSDEQEQVDQQKLQSQMLKFQQMMSQMMSFKIQSTQMKDNERKHKAEQLFNKMFANIIDQQQE